MGEVSFGAAPRRRCARNLGGKLLNLLTAEYLASAGSEQHNVDPSGDFLYGADDAAPLIGVDRILDRVPGDE